MFDALPPDARSAAITTVALVLGILVAALAISWAMEKAEEGMVADLPPDEGGGYAHPAMNDRGHIFRAADGMRNAIQRDARREAAILGLKPDILILNEDGDVDTVPPLSADREALLRKIDRVEQDMHRQLAFKGGAPRCGELMHQAMDETAEHAVGGFWRSLQTQKDRAERALHGFPVSLVGCGVSIPAAHQGELA